jgi:ankyrin repeat protein
LLSKGADPDARDNRGTAPLAQAVKSGAYEIERDLLAADAEIDARDQAGRTALIEAVSQGDAESTRTLVAAGADIMARDAEGESPLTAAIKRSPALLQFLLTQATVNGADPDGKTPLRVIVETKPTVDFLTLAVATGARLDARDRFAATSLHAALRAGDKDTAGRLAKAGADVFARDKDGDTPASIAMASGLDALKALVTAAGIAAKDKQGNGWLHYAAISANAEAASWLLTAGADKAGKNIAGETAYDVAQKRGKADLSALLKPGSP